MNRGVAFLIGLVLLIPLTIHQIGAYYKGYMFDIEVANYLKRAADAPSLVLATEAMDTAIEGIESRGLTEGNSGIIFKKPEHDVGYWYKQITDARAELAQAEEEGGELVESNALMKLREVLLDSGSEGDALTVPIRAATFPNHVAWTVTLWIFAPIGIVGAIFIFGSFSSH